MLPDKIFTNVFADPDITDMRLSAFTADTLNRLARLDTAGKYDAVKNAVAAAGKALQQEISGVDQHLNHRKGKTGVVDSVFNHFKQQMSELEGMVAYAVGGYQSEAYNEFYPHGVTEYRLANKTHIPILLNRVYDAADDYGDRLGPDLKARLQAFRAEWQAARDSQEQAKGAVSGSRAGRGSARHNLEIALMVLIYTIATDYAGNAAACKAWFDFSLLAAAAHPSRRHKGHPDAPADGGS